jgi:hypothetical protein
MILPPTFRVNCDFIQATDAEVYCTRTDKFLFFPIHRQFHFARPDVASVRLTRPNLSGFVGGAIGAGAGIGFVGGIVATNGETDHSEDGLAYGLSALLFGAIGSAIGTGTDFMGGPTIYRAP